MTFILDSKILPLLTCSIPSFIINADTLHLRDILPHPLHTQPLATRAVLKTIQASLIKKNTVPTLTAHPHTVNHKHMEAMEALQQATRVVVTEVGMEGHHHRTTHRLVDSLFTSNSSNLNKVDRGLICVLLV
jgi:hypothetical protein